MLFANYLGHYPIMIFSFLVWSICLAYYLRSKKYPEIKTSFQFIAEKKDYLFIVFIAMLIRLPFSFLPILDPNVTIQEATNLQLHSFLLPKDVPFMEIFGLLWDKLYVFIHLGHMPFLKIVHAVLINLLPFSEPESIIIFLRCVQIVLGIISVVLAFRLFQYFCDRKKAYLASTLFAAVPVFHYYSWYIEPYTLLLLFGIISTDSFLRINDGKRYAPIYLISIIFGFFTHYIFLVVPFAHFLSAIKFRFRYKLDYRKAVYSIFILALILTLCAPLFLMTTQSILKYKIPGYMDYDPLLILSKMRVLVGVPQIHIIVDILLFGAVAYLFGRYIYKKIKSDKIHEVVMVGLVIVSLLGSAFIELRYLMEDFSIFIVRWMIVIPWILITLLFNLNYSFKRLVALVVPLIIVNVFYVAYTSIYEKKPESRQVYEEVRKLKKIYPKQIFFYPIDWSISYNSSVYRDQYGDIFFTCPPWYSEVPLQAECVRMRMDYTEHIKDPDKMYQFLLMHTLFVGKKSQNGGFQNIFYFVFDEQIFEQDYVDMKYQRSILEKMYFDFGDPAYEKHFNGISLYVFSVKNLKMRSFNREDTMIYLELLQESTGVQLLPPKENR